jgi:hypothetical protein
MKLILDGLSVEDAKELLSSVEISAQVIRATEEERPEREIEKDFHDWFALEFADGCDALANPKLFFKSYMRDAFIAGTKARAKHRTTTA